MKQFEQIQSQEKFLEERGIRTIVSLGVYGAAPVTGYAEKYGELPVPEFPLVEDEGAREYVDFGD